MKNKYHIAILLAILAIALTELLRTAWLSDDAAITLRTVLNWTHGYGATFNVGERVQAFTHPLWFLGISFFTLLFHNVYTATFVLSIGLSLSVFYILFRRVSQSWEMGVLTAGILLTSKSYVDFSTSGLENPLAHFLLLLTFLKVAHFYHTPSSRSLRTFFLFLSLIFLTRADLLLLVLPVTIMTLLQARREKLKCLLPVLWGLLPVFLWTLFSVIYYGFPWPNTAYAKLGAGIPFADRVWQGGRYVLESMRQDPVALVFIAGAMAGIFYWKQNLKRLWSWGIILYVLYTIAIGGDFMAGRFFTAPLIISLALYAQTVLERCLYKIAFALTVAILGLLTLSKTLLSPLDYKNTVISSSGIADERGFYFERFRLLDNKRWKNQGPWKMDVTSLAITCGELGFSSLEMGPGTYLIDTCALTDPLLARLPAQKNPHWRIGHFFRQMPTDYMESLRTNSNILKDAKTKELYDSILKITRGPLWSWERFREILKLNIYGVNHRDFANYREGYVQQSSSIPNVALDSVEHLSFSHMLEIPFSSLTTIHTLKVTLNSESTYLFEYLVEGHYVWFLKVPAESAGGLQEKVYNFEIPFGPTDRIRIVASGGTRAFVEKLVINP